MTVNATDADDGITVNNGIIGYSIISEEPKSAQQMFTINPENGVISVIGTGLDREVGALAVSCCAARQLCHRTGHRTWGCRSPGVWTVWGFVIPGSPCPALGVPQP